MTFSQSERVTFFSFHAFPVFDRLINFMFKYLVGKYLITIFTGDKRNAGTDADVRITLYGKQGDSGEHLLDTSKKSFERGQIDKFSIDCPSLGELTKIQIGHNNKGSAPGNSFISFLTCDRFSIVCK